MLGSRLGGVLNRQVGQGGVICNDSKVDELDAAQAAELVRALRDELREMTHQLARLERQGVVASKNGPAVTIRYEAAARRRDIKEAQGLIDRLERRYLNGKGDARPARSAFPDLGQPTGRW